MTTLMTLFVCCACGALEPADPEVDSIDPTSATQGQAQAVSIRGTFYVDAFLGFGPGSRATVDSRFSLMMAGVPLDRVTYVDSHLLQAVVPATLGPGIYSLLLRDPGGRKATLDRAFTVTLP